ncbi:sensor histidine kinase [Kiloniella sp.]|uniref:sensor histidine kinase n=1 Tax=Kiloniella sp. TaxID=1938587 RepID=UPI003B01410B
MPPKSTQQSGEVPFLASMSHELRTPLNAIIGFSEILSLQQNTMDQMKTAEYVSYIYESGTHLLSLIDDILNFADLEAGKFELTLSEFTVNELINSCITRVKPSIEQKNITLEMTIPDLQMTGDQQVLRQILTNVISNAVKFNKQGGSINLSLISEKNDVLTFVIEDTGVGMSKKELSSATKRFAQASSSYIRSEGGSGLGLSLADHYIALAGGTLSITSEKNVGTRVEISFPSKILLEHKQSREFSQKED